MGADELHAIDWAQAVERIERFLQVLVELCGMELSHVVSAGESSDRVRLRVVFTGPDTKMLIARNAELLHAIESVAAGILRLVPEDHDILSFDAEGYRAGRAQQIGRAAEVALASVRATGRPYAFAPMNSRERRMLHLELADSGLRTASSGEASRRFVVLYPADQSVDEESSVEGSAGRARTIRNAFRPR